MLVSNLNSTATAVAPQAQQRVQAHTLLSQLSTQGDRFSSPNTATSNVHFAGRGGPLVGLLKTVGIAYGIIFAAGAITGEGVRVAKFVDNQTLNRGNIHKTETTHTQNCINAANNLKQGLVDEYETFRPYSIGHTGPCDGVVGGPDGVTSVRLEMWKKANFFKIADNLETLARLEEQYANTGNESLLQQMEARKVRIGELYEQGAEARGQLGQLGPVDLGKANVAWAPGAYPFDEEYQYQIGDNQDLVQRQTPNVLSEGARNQMNLLGLTW